MIRNQYPENWSSGIFNKTVEKNLGEYKKTAKTLAEYKSNDNLKQDIPTLFLPYRGNLVLRLNEKMQKITNLSDFQDNTKTKPVYYH